MNCKKCGHRLLKHINRKTGKITYLHYNRFYFRRKAINDKHCSKCETEGRICDKPIIVLLFLIFFLSSISASGSIKSLDYVLPTPEDNSILNQTFVEVNVSIEENTSSTNCILFLINKNNTTKVPMKKEGKFCYQEYPELRNNTNYTIYMTIVDKDLDIYKSKNLSFVVKYDKLICSFKNTYGIRNCVVNWLEESIGSILVTIIIICAAIIGIDAIKKKGVVI